MDYELRIIVEKVAVSSQEVVKRDTIKIHDIQHPESIVDLGLRHAEQISLLEKVQNAVLAEQSVLIDSGATVCPKCGQKLRKNGAQVSDFHAVFSDHTLRLQRHCCSNPVCHWQGASTVQAVFETVAEILDSIWTGQVITFILPVPTIFSKGANDVWTG